MEFTHQEIEHHTNKIAIDPSKRGQLGERYMMTPPKIQVDFFFFFWCSVEPLGSLMPILAFPRKIRLRKSGGDMHRVTPSYCSCCSGDRSCTELPISAAKRRFLLLRFGCVNRREGPKPMFHLIAFSFC